MNVSNNASIIQELDNIIVQKKNLVGNEGFINKPKLSSLIKTQLELISFLDKDSTKQLKFILTQVAMHMTNEKLDALQELKKLDKTQESLLIDSLETELKKIISDCETLKKLLIEESAPIDKSDVSNYNKLFFEELSVIDNLKALSKVDGVLEKNFVSNLRVAKSIDYNRFWSPIIRKVAGVFVKIQWKVKLEGKENIVMHGPVIFASRHYHGDFDGGALISSIHRRMFILVGLDWIQSKFDMATTPWAYKRMGTVPMNRPDSPFATHYPEATSISAMRKLILLLQSKEAVLVFPEAWPNIDGHYTIKKTKDEFLPLRRGFLSCLEEAQRNPREIPVQPIGLVYNESKKILTINIGKPLYYELTPNNRKIVKNADVIRTSFYDTITVEIKRLSGLN